MARLKRVWYFLCSPLAFLGFKFLLNMGIGEDHNQNSHKHHNHMMSFHLHIPHLYFHHHHEKEDMKDISKGCLDILVGQGEEQQRIVIPLIYFNHPLFIQLLKEAEEEYEFEHKGPITIPSHVEEFRTIQGMIDREKSHHHHHLQHNHHAWCFKV